MLLYYSIDLVLLSDFSLIKWKQFVEGKILIHFFYYVYTVLWFINMSINSFFFSRQTYFKLGFIYTYENTACGGGGKQQQKPLGGCGLDLHACLLRANAPFK